MAEWLFGGGTNSVVPPLIPIHHRSIWLRRPHELRYRFGQHAPVLLAFFDFLFSLFLVLDVGAGANIFEDLALRIVDGHSLHKEPAIRPGFALLQPLFRLIRRAGWDRAMPHRHDPLPIIRMLTLHP